MPMPYRIFDRPIAIFKILIPIFLLSLCLASVSRAGTTIPAAPREQEYTILGTDGASSGRISLGSLRQNESISLRYVRGAWTAYPRSDYPPGSPDDSTVIHYNVLPLRICERHDKLVTELAIVPSGTKDRPFVYTAPRDLVEVVLNNRDEKPSNNLGEVVYQVTVSASIDVARTATVAEVAFVSEPGAGERSDDQPAQAEQPRGNRESSPAGANAAHFKPPISPVLNVPLATSGAAIRRAAKLETVRARIDRLAELSLMMPVNRRADSETGRNLREAKRLEAQFVAQTDESLEAEIRAEQASATAEQASREAEVAALQRAAQLDREQQELVAESHRLEIAANRAARWPNWHGAFMICPTCRGSGRDADAEREQNTRVASAAASQMVGSGRLMKMPAAVIACSLCGGAGEVPDNR